MNLRTCVFPCAGFGTRFFPATKVIPKEMLPLGNEPVAVLLPDDVILADEPCLHQMRRVFEETGRPVVALMEVPQEETSRYGIVAGDMLGNRRFKVREMVEKPKINPPSRYAIIG